MSQNQLNFTSKISYARRISRTVTIALALAISIFSLFGIRGIAIAASSRVEQSHTSGINRVITALEGEVEGYTEDASLLARSSVIDRYLSELSLGQRTSPAISYNEAAGQLANLIDNNPALYTQIDILTLQGIPQARVINQNGQPSITNRNSLLQEPVEVAQSQAFTLLADGTTIQPTLGEFRLLRERGQAVDSNIVLLDMFVPIFSQTATTPRSILHVEIDATELLSIVNLADISLVDQQPNRNVILLGNDDNIIADSDTVSVQYLENIETDNNTLDSDVYRNLREFARTNEGDITTQTALTTGSIYTLRNISFAGVSGVDWRLAIVDSWLTIYSSTLFIIAIVVALTVGLSASVAQFLNGYIMRQLAPVSAASDRLEQLARPERGTAPTRPADELLESVTYVNRRIERLSEEVNEQVKRRNRDLQVAGRIGREAATQEDLDTLVPRSINLICNELGFYHGQVFLLDDAGVNAELRYSRGEAGQKLLAQGHSIRVGSDTIIGTVTLEKRPVIVNDTRNAGSEPHGYNPLLPDTRAEMGLPLVIGGNVIGALDLQSRHPHAFLEDDIPTYQLVADQIAIAIYNAQLREQTRQRLQQVDRLNSQLTRSAWQETEEKLDLAGEYGATDVIGALRAPISIRGEVIGTLDADLPQGQQFNEGDRMILQAIAERVSLAIENARLFQETQTSLSETSTLYQLSRQLNESDTLEDVLQAIVVTVAPDATGAQVWLFDDHLAGEEPDWVRINADLAIDPRDQTIDWQGKQLQFGRHPFFDRLQPTEVLGIQDIQEAVEGDETLRQLFTEFNARAAIFIPLNMRGVWKGFLSIEFGRTRQFSERETRIYSALIGQAGVAIDNRLLLQQTEDALSRQEKLYSASRIINTTQNLPDLVYAAVATTSDPTLNFWLALLEGETNDDAWPSRARIIARSDRGTIEEVDDIHELNLPENSPMRNREPDVLVDPGDDVEDVPPRIQWLREHGLEFMAMFPLFSENRPIALFYIVADKPHELSADDYEVYRALTGQMSTQIQNARLLQRTEATLQDIRRLYVASRAIASAQNLESIYDSVAGHLAMPFIQSEGTPTYISMSLVLARPEPSLNAPSLEYVYQWKSDPTRPASVKVGAVVSQNNVPLGQIISENDDSLLVYDNIKEDAPGNDALQEMLIQDGATAAIVAPLWSRQQWFGALILRTDDPDLLEDSYRRFVQAIADQLAIAIENQSLLEEAEAQRERLNTILSTLPTGVLVLDPETFKPQQHNEQVEALLGKEINYDHPFTAKYYNMYRTGTNQHYPDNELAIYQAQREGTQQTDDDAAIFHPNGRHTDILVNAAPIFTHDGKQQAIVAAFQDISTLRSMENTMQENLRETVLLYETQRTLAESNTLDELLDNLIMQLAMEQPSDAYIILNDPDNDQLQLARNLMQSIDDVESLRPILKSELVTINDVLRSNRLNSETRETLSNIGARSAMVLPLRTKSRNQSLGWILLVDTEPEAFTGDEERTMSSVADMASTAIDNSYLVNSTQDALQETAALYNAATTISRSRDLPELFTALENAVDTLESDMYFIFLEREGEVVNELSHNMDDSFANGMDFERLATLPVRKNGLFISDITRVTLGDLEREVAKAENIRAFAMIELRLKEKTRGRIFIGYQDAHEFGEGDTRYLNTIADSASVVVDNQLLLEQIQATLQEQSVLYQASKGLTEVDDPEDVIDVIVNYVIEPHINQVFIALLNTASWDSKTAAVEVVASWQSETDVDLLGVTLSPDQFPAWTQLSTNRVLTISDVEKEDLDILEKTSIESLDTRSLVIIPLQVPGRSIGAIWLGSQQPYTYDDQHLRIFQAFGEQTSLTLEARRLLAQTDQRARQLQTSSAISQTVSQILDLDVLLPQVVDLIKEQFNYDQVQVFLMDDNNEYAELRASTGEAGQKLLSINHKLARGSESVIGRVTELGEPSIALDTADANVVHRPNPYLPLTRSEMALPLLVKGEVVGALDVQSNKPNAFGDEDIQALTTLASQIAVAIDNARLYENAERRSEDMSFLFEITTAAAAANTLEDSLATIANMIYDSVRSDGVLIYLPQQYEDPYGNRKTLMTLTAASNNLSLHEDDVTQIEVGDKSHLIGEAATTLQSEIVADARQNRRYTPVISGARSAILVPVSSGGELVGMIAMESRTPNIYDRETVKLMRTLSGSISAVIQNTVLVERLQESNEQLREIDRLKSQFLASMSHELRTPLNSIIGFSRVMLKGIDGPLTDMQEQDLQTIYTSGNHLLGLINDILDQAKIEANELNLKFDHFDIKPMVEGVKSIAIGMMKDKDNLTLDVEVAPNLPKAYGDEFRTRQILLNLTSNAIKFTQEGSIMIRAYAVEGSEGPLIRLDVEDTGIGIEEKDMPILFEQFRQVDSSLTRTVGGTGLGLPISKSLTELQGGEMFVESELNVGSVFSFTIPTYEGAEKEIERKKAEKSAASKAAKPLSSIPDVQQSGLIRKEDVERARKMADNKIADDNASGGNGSSSESQPAKSQKKQPESRAKGNNLTQNIPMMNNKRDVVLVEDSKEMVDQFRRILQREGFEVTTAEHPAYAEAMVGQLRPSLVILDVNFADGRGWDILESLKERDDTFDIPIIITTMSDESERAYRLGAHTFIQRPFMPDDLMEKVLKAEKESQRERILIIDDQPDAIRLLTQLLDQHGDFRVFSAESGDEGISLVARRRPDLIILDLRMPNKDGFAVLDELRGNPETAKIPVLVVTGDVDLSATELEQLKDIHVLQKTDISQEEYDKFIENINAYLEAK